MALRWRDFPGIDKSAAVPKNEPPPQSSEAVGSNEKLDLIMAQLQQLEARMAEASEVIAKLDAVMTELSGIETEAQPSAEIAPMPSEQVFN